MLSQFNLDEENELEFAYSIQGTVEKPSLIRFIIEGEKFEVSCFVHEQGSNLYAKVPPLKGMLKEGTYNARLELVIDNKVFIPLRETIELKPVAEVMVNKQIKKTPIKENIQINIKLKPLMERLKTAGYDVESYKDDIVLLKKDGKYCGIANETKTIKSNKSYSTINELIESL